MSGILGERHGLHVDGVLEDYFPFIVSVDNMGYAAHIAGYQTDCPVGLVHLGLPWIVVAQLRAVDGGTEPTVCERERAEGNYHTGTK